MEWLFRNGCKILCSENAVLSNKDTQMKYFLDDNNDVWAMDEKENQFVFSYKTKKLEPTKRLNLLWGGCSEEYAKQRMNEIVKNA